MGHENYFFDGPNHELHQEKAVFRVRLMSDRCEASIKDHSAVTSGSTLRFAATSDITLEQGQQAVQDPNIMLTWDGALFTNLKTIYGVKSLHPLGSFRNRRVNFAWHGMKLKLDDTEYPFGHVYEIEASDFTDPVKDVQEQIRRLLATLGVSCRDSTITKFQRCLRQHAFGP
eukprot:NODE_2371_length_618_cov_125.701230_g2014_i0.p1 GENE.NODE_2371_length_618_cov_125.701230_g2014_i0~~NODE_2371_length_618_cov_125.701230_g2014_i0.p1  ORF type:complete len:172 (-),score=17.23 NODE_2371_length_618_cov_125.701230_g2014_i0:72-587(-)